MNEKLWAVPVRNEQTGEVRTITVEAGHTGDAQLRALIQVFHDPEWPGRKYTALHPCRVSEEDVA